MLTAIEISSGVKIFARDAIRSKASFICPGCLKHVILHKGDKKIHHFQHKANSMFCHRGEMEGEENQKIKLSLFDALKNSPGVEFLEVEKCFDRLTADIFAVIHGIPVAIELQKSSMNGDFLAWKACCYREMGIFLLWIALPNGQIQYSSRTRYEVKPWEYWLHLAYFGRVYYWIQGQILQPVHFEPMQMGTRPIKGEATNPQTPLKSREAFIRRPLMGVPVILSRDFCGIEKNAFSASHTDIPDCLLYMDNQPTWWKIKKNNNPYKIQNG